MKGKGRCERKERGRTASGAKGRRFESCQAHQLTSNFHGIAGRSSIKVLLGSICFQALLTPVLFPKCIGAWLELIGWFLGLSCVTRKMEASSMYLK